MLEAQWLVRTHDKGNGHSFLALDDDFILQDARLDEILLVNEADFSILVLDCPLKTTIRLPVGKLVKIAHKLDHALHLLGLA